MKPDDGQAVFTPVESWPLPMLWPSSCATVSAVNCHSPLSSFTPEAWPLVRHIVFTHARPEVEPERSIFVSSATLSAAVAPLLPPRHHVVSRSRYALMLPLASRCSPAAVSAAALSKTRCATSVTVMPMSREA